MTTTGNGPRIRAMSADEMDRYSRVRALAYRHAPEVAGALYTLNPVYAEGLGTWAVDDRGRIYISFEGWAGDWTDNQRAFVLIHEIWHFLRRHPQRGLEVLPDHPQWKPVWAIAVDMEINDDIAAMDGCDLPEGCVYPHTHELPEEWVAEQYAEALAQKQKEQGGDQGGDQGGKGSQGEAGSGSGSGSQGGDQDGQGSGSQGGDQDGDQDGQGGSSGGQGGAPGDMSQNRTPGTLGNCAEVPEEWKDAADKIAEPMSEGMKEYVEKAVAEEITRRAEQGIGNTPGGIKDWAAGVLAPPKIDWRRKLRAALSGQVVAVRGRARDTYHEPSRRHDHRTFILPGRRSTDPNVLIATDTSGSMMWGGVLEQAISEATSILRARGLKKIRTMEVDVLATETGVQRGRNLRNLDTTGGGTDMRVAYDAVRDMPAGKRPSNFVLLTDGLTPWPDESDAIPGVHCLVGIIADEGGYRSRINDLPSWIIPVHVPIPDEG